MGNDEKADEMADQLIKRNPADPEVLFLKGVTQTQLGKRKSALKFLDSALAYNPLIAEAHGLKAAIYFQLAEFEDAVEAAETGLSINPQNETCLTYRSMALLKLGRKDEHFDADKQALKNNPMNSFTHASVGYSALENGEHDKAKEHFREALRIDPSDEYARQGMLQAIKSTNLFYRLFLRYMFWMQGLKPQVRWAVIIVGYFLIQGLNMYSDTLGVFTPIAEVVIAAYMIFAISTWIIGPVSNIFLRFHDFGKFVLSEEEKSVANKSAALLSTAILGAILLYLAGENAILWKNLGLYLLTVGIALTVIVSSISNCRLQKSKNRLKKLGIIYAVGCSILIVSAIILPGLALKLFTWLIYGFIGYQFYANTQE
jgi:tetratricopeptide (TPR) repeat protein